jgi:hypothetical protein
VFWCAIFFNSLVCELTARCAGQNSEEESGFCGHCELLGLIFFWDRLAYTWAAN